MPLTLAVEINFVQEVEFDLLSRGNLPVHSVLK